MISHQINPQYISMLDHRKTIKKLNQAPSCFFSSFRFVFEEFLPQLPELVFKIIDTSEYMPFHQNDFYQAKKQNKRKALLIYQMGISMKLQEADKQLQKLKGIMDQNKHLESQNQTLNLQIKKQQGERDQNGKSNRCTNSDFFSSKKSQESIEQSSIEIDMDSPVPKAHWVSQPKKKKNDQTSIQTTRHQGIRDILESEGSQVSRHSSGNIIKTESIVFNPNNTYRNSAKIKPKIKPTISFPIKDTKEQSKIQIIVNSSTGNFRQKKPISPRYGTNYEIKESCGFRILPKKSVSRTGVPTHKTAMSFQKATHKTGMTVQKSKVSFELIPIPIKKVTFC